MKRLLALCVLWGGLAHARGDGEWSDRLSDALTFSSANHDQRAKLSGTCDLEAYRFEDVAPGLIYTGSKTLFNPRLSLFLDVQMGSRVYGFVQGRVDRGFDPGEGKLASRLDEYALRYTPWSDGRLSLQIGKFSTIVGNWVGRHLSWDNPFIGAPLAYENQTAVWDSAPPDAIGTLQGWAHLFPNPFRTEEYADKILRLPIIWGPSYATGAAVSGKCGKFEYAAEVKNASLSSRPENWDLNRHAWASPTVSARLGFRPNQMWNLGFSFSEGTYLAPRAERLIPQAQTLQDYRQTVLSQDVGFAWHHLQIWAEAFECRFETPKLGEADVLSYYVEAKYKFTPQFFGAVRWNEERFRQFKLFTGGTAPWGRDVSRLDLAGTYRLSVAAQLKIQYSFQEEKGSPFGYNSLAAQFTFRF